MSRREESIEHHRSYCVHYDPQPGQIKIGCKAGVDMDTVEKVSPSEGKPQWAPCIGGHELPDPCKVCPKWERRSMESAEEYADSVEKLFRELEVATPLINEWRAKDPQGKAEVVECPVCKGRLHLLQAACNGHVHARCETDDCIHFME